MIKFDVRVSPRTAYEPGLLLEEVCRQAGVDQTEVKDLRVERRSIDARQRRVMVNVSGTLYLHGESAPVERGPEYGKLAENAPSVTIVGAGPAGLFAALRLIEEGIRPVILERGKDVDSRRKDLARIARENHVDPDSNYCFGEGGAGAYSDGKLYTRSHKRGDGRKILAILHDHGAREDILIDAHPHIGSDRLPQIIKNIRTRILECGGEVHFGAHVSDIEIVDGRLRGVHTTDGRFFEGPAILATGHSARDVYRMLDRAGVAMQPKGIAVGVRLEHPQGLIDRLRYHSPEGRGRWLPPAEYTMLTRFDNRAVYSFCMCPGGIVVPAASTPDELVVNGMSPSNRGSRWANSGMVVEILPEDVESSKDDTLKMMRFQSQIEQAFYNEGGRTQNAPAQRMDDFCNGRMSQDLPPTSYAPGIHPARVDRLLPEMVSTRLRRGFEEFGRKQRGFLSHDATVIGCETRTSAPVRIPRDESRLHHPDVVGLFPCGEGAGFAGGIVSAAIDGERCAVAAAQLINFS